MAKHLKVMLVEDSEEDSWLILRELERGGYLVEHLRIDGAAAMRRALEKGGWDLILSDYRLPGFSAPAALERAGLARSRSLN